MKGQVGDSPDPEAPPVDSVSAHLSVNATCRDCRTILPLLLSITATACLLILLTQSPLTLTLPADFTHTSLHFPTYSATPTYTGFSVSERVSRAASAEAVPTPCAQAAKAHGLPGLRGRDERLLPGAESGGWHVWGGSLQQSGGQGAGFNGDNKEEQGQQEQRSWGQEGSTSGESMEEDSRQEQQSQRQGEGLPGESKEEQGRQEQQSGGLGGSLAGEEQGPAFFGQPAMREMDRQLNRGEQLTGAGHVAGDPRIGTGTSPGAASSSGRPAASGKGKSSGTITAEQWDNNGVTVYGDACGYGPDEMARVMVEPHEAHQGGRRYYFEAAWMGAVELQFSVDKARRRVRRGDTVCVLAHLHGHVPCADRPCVVPLHMRPHFTDVMVLRQLVERGDFNFLYGYNFTSILDAGANVGFASIIFGIQFPRAKVVAIELSPDNYKVLQRNTAFLPNVVPLNAGLYSSIKTLNFSHGPDGPREGWKYMLQDNNDSDNNSKNSSTQAADLSLADSKTSSEGKQGSKTGTQRAAAAANSLAVSGTSSAQVDSFNGQKGSDDTPLVKPTLAPSGDVIGTSNADVSAAEKKKRKRHRKWEVEAEEEEASRQKQMSIKTVTMDFILQLFNLPGFEFIKMDVEGSEREIFGGDSGASSKIMRPKDEDRNVIKDKDSSSYYSPHPWIEASSLLVIETHDRMKSRCKETVVEAMKRHPKFSGTKVGEYETFFDSSRVPHPLKHPWGPSTNTTQ